MPRSGIGRGAGIFSESLRSMSVDRRWAMVEPSPSLVDLGAVPPAADRPLVLLLCAGTGDR